MPTRVRTWSRTWIKDTSSVVAVTMAFIVSLSHAAEPEIPPESQRAIKAALAWQMPHNPCHEPRMRGKGHDVINTVSPNAARISDVDHYTLQRYERQVKRWQTCERKYRSGLLKDAKMLQAAARQGMTQTQLAATRDKLIAIKHVLMPGDQAKASE